MSTWHLSDLGNIIKMEHAKSAECNKIHQQEQSGANFMELLSTQICWAPKTSCLLKTGYQTKLHVIFTLSKTQPNSIHKQYITHENVVGELFLVHVSKTFLC